MYSLPFGLISMTVVVGTVESSQKMYKKYTDNIQSYLVLPALEVDVPIS